MSYARFGSDGSDVYVFSNGQGEVECCGCVLQEREWVDDPTRPVIKGYLRRIGEIVPYRFLDEQEAVAHFDRHRAAGHTVPENVYVQILDPQEIEWRRGYRGRPNTPQHPKP